MLRSSSAHDSSTMAVWLCWRKRAIPASTSELLVFSCGLAAVVNGINRIEQVNQGRKVVSRIKAPNKKCSGCSFERHTSPFIL